jgi:hypothetical protein
MKRSTLFIFVAMLSIVVGMSILAYNSLFAFRGEIRIRTDSAEALAIAPQSESRVSWLNRVQRLPGREIPFADPPNAVGWIDANQYYDVVALPFAIAVVGGNETVSRDVGGTLSIQGPGGEQRVDATLGRRFSVGVRTLEILRVRPWRGLVPAPGNPAMAAIGLAVDGGDLPLDSVFVPDGAWLRLDARTALHFQWVSSVEAAEEAESLGLVRNDAARWGVLQEGKSEWLSTFQPGSGLIMTDGTSITLIQRDDNHPGPLGPTSAIEVEVQRDEIVERHWLGVNEELPEYPIRYENLTMMPRILHAVAWEPGRISVSVVEQGVRKASSKIEKGQTWTVPQGDLKLRLDEVLPAATAIDPESSSFFEVVLQDAERQIRVAEHMEVQLDTVALRLKPEIEPATVEFTLAIYQPDLDEPKTIRLGPSDAVVVANWELRQHPTRLTSRDSAVLQVRKLPSKGADVTVAVAWITGVIALVLGIRRRRV